MSDAEHFIELCESFVVELKCQHFFSVKPDSHDEHQKWVSRRRSTARMVNRAVDGAAKQVTGQGGDGIPFYELASLIETEVCSIAEVNSKLLTAKAIIRSTDAASKNDPLATIADDDQSDGATDKGVSLRDVGIALDYIDEELKLFVRRFSDSKRITSDPLGKCPKDKRAKLYRLSEILNDLETFSSMSPVENRRIRKHLESVERFPAS